VAKHDVARFVDVLVEQEARFGVAQELSERSLAALDGFAAQIIAVKLDQVEGVKEDVPVLAAVAQSVEARQAIPITGHRFTIDQAGTHLKPVNGLDDERIARCPIVSVPGWQADADRVSARHQATAVMLDFVNPLRAGRRSVGWVWEGGIDEAGRCSAGAQQHVENQITGRRPLVESVNCPLTIRWQPWCPHGDHPSTGPGCQPRGARPSNRVVTSRMPAFTEGRRRAEHDAIRAAEATK
jgi:hypothetical protein